MLMYLRRDLTIVLTKRKVDVMNSKQIGYIICTIGSNEGCLHIGIGGEIFSQHLSSSNLIADTSLL